MSAALETMRLARLGPLVTTPASRHAAMIAESLFEIGEGCPLPAWFLPDRENAGDAIANTVADLWRKTSDLIMAKDALTAIRNGLELGQLTPEEVATLRRIAGTTLAALAEDSAP